MAILMLSDPTGQTEAVLFPEAYNTYGPSLESNMPIIIDVTLAQEGERLRIATEHLQPLDAVLKTRPEIIVQVENPASLKNLQELFGSEPGHTKCQIRLRRQQQEIVMNLPQGIHYTGRIYNALQNLPGVALLN